MRRPPPGSQERDLDHLGGPLLCCQNASHELEAHCNGRQRGNDRQQQDCHLTTTELELLVAAFGQRQSIQTRWYSLRWSAPAIADVFPTRPQPCLTRIQPRYVSIRKLLHRISAATTRRASISHTGRLKHEPDERELHGEATLCFISGRTSRSSLSMNPYGDTNTLAVIEQAHLPPRSTRTTQSPCWRT